MEKIYIIGIIIIVIILIFALYEKPSLENFTLTKCRRHALMGEGGRLISISDKIPEGKYKYTCHQTVCPASYEDDVMCWKCMERGYLIETPDKPVSRLRPLHAVYDDRYLMYVSDKKPCRLGDYSCWPKKCPEPHDKGLYCWQCQTGIHKPQLE
uniref:Uncharacterized protein n=1 Tax=Mimivirus LCMiAC01 TaxID=2506608 RepID=A0A481YZ93_9VIRU|nr:MAG: hypothetical protein LCMiAC01_02500 [Mimivirus LCMiAC01]